MSYVSSARLHGLDALRGGALLLGVFFHAAFSFLPGDQLWLVMDVQRSASVSGGAYVLHIFRMTTFFVLAGYFGRMQTYRLGTGAFLRDRLQRIGVPLIVFWPDDHGLHYRSLYLGHDHGQWRINARKPASPSAADTQDTSADTLMVPVCLAPFIRCYVGGSWPSVPLAGEKWVRKTQRHCTVVGCADWPLAALNGGADGSRAYEPSELASFLWDPDAGLWFRSGPGNGHRLWRRLLAWLADAEGPPAFKPGNEALASFPHRCRGAE